jgi:CTP:molybdopterin cytidylyltransferase MocA
MGRNKLLLPLGKSTVLRHIAVEILKAAGGLIVVTGKYNEETKSALSGLGGITIVENAKWEKGMVSSAQAGIRELPRDVPGFFLHHGDMPFVTADVFRILTQEASSRSASGATELPLVASFCGKAGHPVYFPASLIPAILSLRDGERLKSVIEKAGFALVETSCQGVLEDIDTREDYQRLVGEAAP